ncbi:MAG: hypothetical protein JXR73_13330 [Candidatus Omnitrophica bacterium]|nr:hypothetical protein [Candidatus Omnitrophota bacterium]
MMRSRLTGLALFMIAALAGCSGNGGHPDVLMWGARGGLPGHFAAPRAIEAGGEFVYVIDRLGRVQKFDLQGRYLLEWRIEPNDNGTPTNLAIDEKGELWIPDTHNSRILHYSADGALLSSFGEYGEEEGKFIYPTGICFSIAGDLLIVEYGVRDRVQVFSRTGEYLGKTWGTHGDQEYQFNRPMGIERGPDGLLYIADAANHRLKVYTDQGELVRIMGEQGRGPGQFDFPYDIDIDPQGDLYVAEFANHRVQKLSPLGEPLGFWGSMGSAPGQLYEPWGASIGKDSLFIADTQNHRVQAPLLAKIQRFDAPSNP